MDSTGNGASLYVSLLQAVHVIQEPSATNAQRKAASEYLEEVKDRYGPELFPVALEMFQVQNENFVRHFGCQLMEFLFKRHWQEMAAEHLEEIKQGLLQLLSSRTRKLSEEPGYISEKVGSLLVAAIKRCWPQYWMDLLDSLSAIADIGEMQLCVVFAVLRDLSEETFVFHSELPELRRKELITGLRASLPIIAPLLYRHLEEQYNRFQRQSLTREDHRRAVICLMKTLVEYLEWIPYELIFQYNFVSVLCWLLQTLDFRDAAVDCLLVLFSRKTSPDDGPVVDTLLVLMNVVPNLLGELAGDEADRLAGYGFHKRLAQAMSQFGSAWLRDANASSAPVRGAVPLQSLTKYLEAMLVFAGHPSFLLSSFTVEVWGTIFRSHLDAVREVLCSSALVSSYFEFLLTKLRPVDTALDSPAPHVPFALADFDDQKEFRKFFDQYRSQLRHLLRSAAHSQTDLILNWSIARLAALVAAVSSGSDMSSREQAAETLLLYGAAATIVECVLAIAPPKNAERVLGAEARRLVAQLDGLMGQCRSAEVLSRHLGALLALSGYMAAGHAELLVPLLNQIFRLLTFREPGEESASLHLMGTPSVRVRRRACTALILLAKQAPALLVPHLAGFVSRFQELFDELLHTERIGICEALVLLSNRVPAEQPRLVKQLLLQPFAVWADGNVSKACATWAGLLEFVRLGTDEDSFAPRKMISVPLYTFLAMMKRARVEQSARHPMSEFFPAVLDVVGPLTASIHALWTPDVVAAIPVVHRDILAISPAEKAALSAEEFPPEGSDVATWLYNIRCACYDVFSELVAVRDRVVAANLPQLLQGSLFAHAKYMELRHFRILIQGFFPRFVRVAAENNAGFLDGVAGFLMTETFCRLEAGFVAMAERLQGPGRGQEKEEVEEDKIFHKFAQDVFEVLFRIARPRDSEPKTVHMLSNAFGRLLLTAEHAALPIVYILMNGLWWRNEFCFGRALSLCSRMVMFAQENEQYREIVGRDMLSAAVKGLTETYNRDSYGALCNLLAEIYFTLHGVTDVVSAQMMQLLGLNQSALSELNAKLDAEQSLRKRRALFTRLLTDQCGLDLSQRKKPSILDIPQKLLITKPKHIDFSSEGAVRALFLSTQGESSAPGRDGGVDGAGES